MQNPFPGMNPFLEKPARWPSVQGRYVMYLADAINPLLPEKYVADVGERVYIASPAQEMYPDVYVVRHPGKKNRGSGSAPTATLEADPPVEVEFPQAEIREVFVEIRLTDEAETLVTVIEFLSPANKSFGDGHELYRKKQTQLLASSTSLIEIDLLRAGRHTVAIPREGLPENGWDFVVCLHRGGWEEKYQYWAMPLQDRLPRIHVPLLGNDRDVVVDLQAVLDQCYTTGHWGTRIDYSKPCPPPLSKKDTKWVDELLQKKKLRK
jgi:hypothetical protein